MAELRIVDWYEGMVIKPHHFQQSAITVLAQIGYLLRHSAPYMYGVLDVELHSGGEGAFFIKKIECIMPDYSVLNFHADPNCSVSIKAHFEVFNLYLCISDEYSATSKGRFISQIAEPVKDMQNPTSEAVISRLNIKPFLSTEPVGTCICIAKYSSWGAIKENYDYPSPYFKQCYHAYTWLKAIMNKAKLLIDSKSVAAQIYSKREEDIGLIRFFLIVDSVFSNELSSPMLIYSTLKYGIAHLVDTSSDAWSNLNSKYIHDEILESFTPMFKYIENKLLHIEKRTSNDVGKFRSIKLNNEFTHNRTAFVCEVTGSSVYLVFYMSANGCNHSNQIDTAIIGAYNDIDSLLLKRSKGFERQILKRTDFGEEISYEVRVNLMAQEKPVDLTIIPIENNVISRIYLL